MVMGTSIRPGQPMAKGWKSQRCGLRDLNAVATRWTGAGPSEDVPTAKAQRFRESEVRTSKMTTADFCRSTDNVKVLTSGRRASPAEGDLER